MPALSISTTNIYFGRPYVKLMNTPGVVYLHIDESDDMFMEKLMSSVTGSWPLLVLVILLTIEGGVIIWLLVCTGFFVLNSQLNNRLRSINSFGLQSFFDEYSMLFTISIIIKLLLNIFPFPLIKPYLKLLILCDFMIQEDRYTSMLLGKQLFEKHSLYLSTRFAVEVQQR